MTSNTNNSVKLQVKLLSTVHCKGIHIDIYIKDIRDINSIYIYIYKVHELSVRVYHK